MSEKKSRLSPYKPLPPYDDPISVNSKEYLVLAAKFVHTFREMQKQAYDLSCEKGWWDEGKNRNKAEMIALMHSELSEALEALRKDPEAPDEKCPHYTAVEVELADCIIRIMDFAQGWGLDVASALDAKHRYNHTRPHRHGKKF